MQLLFKHLTTNGGKLKTLCYDKTLLISHKTNKKNI